MITAAAVNMLNDSLRNIRDIITEVEDMGIGPFSPAGAERNHSLALSDLESAQSHIRELLK